MQCPACSTENPAEAAFCQKCGTALNAAAAGYPPMGGYTQVPQSGSAMPGQAMPAGSAAYAPAGAGLSDSAAGAIAYLTFIPAVIFLLLEPYARRPFVRFHAFQCIGLTVASVLVHFLITILLHGFALLLSPLVSLLFFILWLICIVSAAQGKWFKVPLLGNFAEQQARR